MATKLSEFVNGAPRLYPGGSATFDESPPGAAVGPPVLGGDWFAQQGAPGSAGPPMVGGGRLSDAQAEQFFNQLFPGGTVSPEDLEAHRRQLEAAGFTLNPNAGGRITDLTLPSGNTVDPIYGAGSGLNRKQWIVHPGAGAGGPGGIGTGLETSPGYQFRLGEGMKALERSAAARGTLLTGGTAKGLARYAQDYASGEYGNRVNQLMDLARLGGNAAAGAGTAGQSYATQAGDLQTQIGNAQAGATVGGANAWNQALGNAQNLAQMYYLSRLYGGAPGAGGGVPPTLTQWHG